MHASAIAAILFTAVALRHRATLTSQSTTDFWAIGSLSTTQHGTAQDREMLLDMTAADPPG
jgi:hypothetical protein